MSWTGDPVWLPDVLRDEGLPLRFIDGWAQRGHGDFGSVWGVVDHHTGNDNASAESIAFHPELGLASQLHLSQQGVFTLCGIGTAWHAGAGSWPGLPNGGANQHTIGIEAANDGGGVPGRPHRLDWPAVQYDNYVRGNAAILRFLQYNSSHSIGHKEWAGAAQGKWDPGGIDMAIFRNDIQSLLNGAPTGDDMTGEEHDKLFQLWGALFNPVVSTSKYHIPGEQGTPTKDKIGAIDAMSHEALIERNALLGNKDAIVLVKREADKGDTWAQFVYSKCPK